MASDSKLADMLASSSPKTSIIQRRDIYAEETGKGLGGMTSKLGKIGIVGPLAQEGTAGLSSMTSTYQSSPGGTVTPKGASSDIKST